MPNPNSPAGDDDTSLASVIEKQDGADGAKPDANDDAAGTSDAAGDEGAKPSDLDLEAVVRKAAKGTEPDAEATPADGKGDEGDKPAEAGEVEPTEAEKAEAAAKAQAEADAKLPFHKHPRWQEVLKERDALKGERDSFKAQVGELSTKAEQLDRIGGFMRDNELTPQEVQQGFEIMALMKHDPAAALQKLAPHLNLLELASGKKLPEDLQQKVDAGEVTAEVAQEAAKARMDAAAARQRADRSEQTVQQDRAREAAGAMRTAVEAWEKDVKARDPDYPHMQSFVVDRTRALAAQHPPRTPDEAVALTKRAYDDVKAQMRKVMPPKQPVRTVTTDKSSTHAVAAPSSMEDVVRGALRQ